MADLGLDNFRGVSDSALLTSAAAQLRQRCSVEQHALRSAEEVARRHRAAGDEAGAVRADALAAHLRGATPLLAVADALDDEAHGRVVPIIAAALPRHRGRSPARTV